MGTNFFWMCIKKKPLMKTPFESIELEIDDMDPRVHIGKRSAAGAYCWNCNVTLCRGGNSKIHDGYRDEKWHERCPKCGAEPTKSDGLTEGAAAVEMGFAKPRQLRPTGVTSCSSFSWTQDPERVKKFCKEHLTDKVIVDEYDRELTGDEFLEMLECNCPVEFLHIGESFS